MLPLQNGMKLLEVNIVAERALRPPGCITCFQLKNICNLMLL